MKRRLLTVCLLVSLLLPLFQSFASAEPVEEARYACKSAFLMEASTGKILYAQNENDELPPASVTKVMTLLLVMEALDAGIFQKTDTVSISANAASMGGSQVYLKEGETMTVEDLLKSVVVASANDAAVALAELHSGSVAAFVEKMNEKAVALGMEHTHFENVTGLDDTATDHYTSAKDIAIMSQALISHPDILRYSSIWMDSIRDGAFGLTNTNRLVRYYKGCTGLKTGSTAKAGFCISVTAERNGMTLIAVVMGADSRDHRNSIATEMLDGGFASFGLYQSDVASPLSLPVKAGHRDTCTLSYEPFSAVVPKTDLSKVKAEVILPESLFAPIKNGDEVGKVVYRLENEEIGESRILAGETVNRIGFFELFARMIANSLLT